MSLWRKHIMLRFPRQPVEIWAHLHAPVCGWLILWHNVSGMLEEGRLLCAFTMHGLVQQVLSTQHTATAIAATMAAVTLPN